MKPNEELRHAGAGRYKLVLKSSQSYYDYRSANQKPKAIGHTRRASAAASAGPTKFCCLVLYQKSYRFILPYLAHASSEDALTSVEDFITVITRSGVASRCMHDAA